MNFIDIKEILNILPHKFPFLLLDRILRIKKGKFLYAMKNISFNEQCFQGHFKKNPIFPGVMILEIMAQSMGILVYKSHKMTSNKKKEYYLVSIDNTKFKRFVIPGDQLIIKVNLIKKKKNIIKFSGIAKVKKKIACSSIMKIIYK